MDKRQNTYYFSCGKCFRKLDGKEFKKKNILQKGFQLCHQTNALGIPRPLLQFQRSTGSKTEKLHVLSCHIR